AGALAGMVDARDNRVQVEAFAFRYGFRAKDASDHHFVGGGQGLRQLVLQDIAAQGVGAGLQDGPQAAPGIAGAQSLDGFGDGGGVVGEIVNDGDAVHFGLHFQAALHALERFQGLSNLRFGDAVSNGHGRGSSSVENVVLSGKRKIEVSPVAAFAQDRPVSALTFELQVGGLPGAVVRAIALNWAKGFGHALAHIGVAFVGDDAAAARHQVDQALEGGLHRVQVLVNVCVIELNGSEDDGIGKVVQELGTLVKKGGVVLVPLDDEVAAVAEGETAAEILRDAAHQERR